MQNEDMTNGDALMQALKAHFADFDKETNLYEVRVGNETEFVTGYASKEWWVKPFCEE